MVCFLIGLFLFLPTYNQKPLSKHIFRLFVEPIVEEIKTFPFIRETDWATGKTHHYDPIDKKWLNNPDKPKDHPLTEPEAPSTVGDIRTADDIRREHREYEAYLRSPLLFKSQNPDFVRNVSQQGSQGERTIAFNYQARCGGEK